MRQIGTGEISDQNNDRNNDLNEWILLNILRGKKNLTNQKKTQTDKQCHLAMRTPTGESWKKTWEMQCQTTKRQDKWKEFKI